MHVNKISVLIFFISTFLVVGCKDKTTEQACGRQQVQRQKI